PTRRPSDLRSGKLSTTFPIDVKGKAPDGWPYVPATTFGENPVTYDEGIYVGYRYYDTFNVPVSYEFGYGKNYSDFSYSKPKLSSKKFNQSIKVSVDVKNTRSEEHTSELQSRENLVCRLLLEKK